MVIAQMRAGRRGAVERRSAQRRRSSKRGDARAGDVNRSPPRPGRAVAAGPVGCGRPTAIDCYGARDTTATADFAALVRNAVQLIVELPQVWPTRPGRDDLRVAPNAVDGTTFYDPNSDEEEFTIALTAARYKTCTTRLEPPRSCHRAAPELECHHRLCACSVAVAGQLVRAQAPPAPPGRRRRLAAAIAELGRRDRDACERHLE